MDLLQEMWPIMIVQDRYGGTYSGGGWLAIAIADSDDDDMYSRASWVLDGINGPHGDDGEAAEFWAHPPSWIATGNSPEEALQNLKVVFTISK